MSTVNSLSTALTVISTNIEGFTASKTSMLSEMCKREHCHCLCLQETHRAPYLARPKIPGMTLIAEQPYIKYDRAILIRNDLKVKGVSVWEHDNVELSSIQMPGVVVHAMYKPPNEKCVLPALGHGNLPHIVIEVFNSHSTTWGYTNTDDNGEAVEQWATSHWFTMQNYLGRSTVQDGREATTPTSSLYLRALIICAENQSSWSLSLTHNIARYVHVQTS